MKRLALPAALLAVCAVVSSSTRASQYPPDYPACASSVTTQAGPFSIREGISNPYTSAINLEITYAGYLLRNHRADDIQIYIRINGNDAMVPLKSEAGSAIAKLYASVHNCGQGSVSSPAGYMCDYPTDLERHLFANIAYQNVLGDLHIELAANAGGQWDSNLSANYQALVQNKHGCGN